MVTGGKQRSVPAPIEIYSSTTTKSSRKKYVLSQRGQNICISTVPRVMLIAIGNLVLSCHAVCSWLYADELNIPLSLLAMITRAAEIC